MSEAAEKPIPIDQSERRRTLGPFLAAGAVVVLVIAGAVLLAALKPAEKNVTTPELVETAVRNYASAQDQSAGARQANACPGFDAARSPLGPAVAGKHVDIVTVTGTAVDGSRAKTTVTSRIDGRETNATWYLSKLGDNWRVCTP